MLKTLDRRPFMFLLSQSPHAIDPLFSGMDPKL